MPASWWTILLGAIALAGLWHAVGRLCLRTKALIEDKPWTFEPIEAGALPKKVEAYFNDQAQAFSAAGFCEIGDYVATGGAAVALTRVLIDRSGQTFACIFDRRQSHYYCCISISRDGVYWETSCTEEGVNPPPPEHGLRYEYVTDGAPESVAAHHRRVLEEANLRGVEFVSFRPEDWTRVFDYGRRLAAWSLKAQGPRPTLAD